MILPADIPRSSQQISHHPVAMHIATIERKVRQQPAEASHRWALFQWLCVSRNWDRAMRQLQVFGQLDAASLALAHACRDLVRAECWREEVMLGRRAPGYVFDDVPRWVTGMIDALKLNACGEVTAADSVREEALETAQSVSGRACDVSFDWISDSDSRLGPVCEIMTAGSYRWLPFADIAAWRISTPATLIDLVWISCSVTLHDGTVMRGFMPSRYPSLPHTISNGSPDDRDALDLGRQTAWHETGRKGVIAVGRKTWTTSVGDIGLFEWPTCTFTGADVAPVIAAGELPRDTRE